MSELKTWKTMVVEYTKFNTEDEKKVMGLNCKMLKNSHFPHYLRIRECKNRFIKGFGDHYMEMAEKVQNALIKLMVDSNGSLTTNYKSRNVIHDNVGTHTPEGTTDAQGNMWVPYFRVFVPIEEWCILQPLGKLKGMWNNLTLKMGKEEGGCHDYIAQRIIQCRIDGLNNGLAEKLIDEVNLRYNSMIPYSIKLTLTSNYRSR